MSQENEQEVEVIEEEVIEDEIIEDESSDGNDTEVDWKARALKAEESIVKNKKRDKKSKPAQKTNKDYQYQSQVDLLRFNNVTDVQIDKLKQIAAIEGIDLIEARQSEYFTLWSEKAEKAEKAKAASMSSSNRGRTIKEDINAVKRRVGQSDDFTMDDIKALVHGKK